MLVFAWEVTYNNIMLTMHVDLFEFPPISYMLLSVHPYY